MIFGGDKRSYETGGWAGLNLDGSVFNHLGESIVDAPFIFQNDRSTLPSVAWQFSLYELIPDAMPFIVVSTAHWTSDTFAFPGRPRLYAYINGQFRYVRTLRTIPSF